MANHAPGVRITRRRALIGSSATVVTALLAACGGTSATDTPKPVAATPAATAASATGPPLTSAVPTAAATSTIPLATATTAPAASAPPAVTAATASLTATTVTGSASAASASSGAVAPVEAGDVIKDAAGHITFAAPKGWLANPDPISPTVAQFSATNPTRGMRVLESSPTEGKSLQQYAKDALATLKTNGSFRAGTREAQPTTLGGEPAVLDDYITQGNGVLSYVVRVLCIRSGLLYSVFFSTEPQAAEALQPVVKLVLDTWKFL